MVEPFNGRISEIVNQTRFGSAAELDSTMRNDVKIYNQNMPHAQQIKWLRMLEKALPVSNCCETLRCSIAP